MEKLKKIGVVILIFFALLLLWKGWNSLFKTDNVYIGPNDFFHSTPYCPYLNDESSVDYIKETGKLIGCEEESRENAIKDLALEMCPYCFSEYHVKERNDYFRDGYKDRYDEKRNEAIQKRKEKKLKELDDWYDKHIKE